MNERLFLLGCALLFSLLIALGWRYLPDERFQMLALFRCAAETTAAGRG